MHTVNSQLPSCSCTAFTLTGKYCSHLWAVHWYTTNGPADEWEGEKRLVCLHVQMLTCSFTAIASSDKMAERAASQFRAKQDRKLKLPHDATWDKETDKILKSLGTTTISAADDSDSASDSLDQTSLGRPLSNSGPYADAAKSAPSHAHTRSGVRLAAKLKQNLKQKLKSNRDRQPAIRQKTSSKTYHTHFVSPSGTRTAYSSFVRGSL